MEVDKPSSAILINAKVSTFTYFQGCSCDLLSIKWRVCHVWKGRGGGGDIGERSILSIHE